VKCPTCHVEFASSAGFHAHVPNCAYKDNPLPEPEQDKPLDRMNKAELLALAGEKGIEVDSSTTKAQIIKQLKEE